MNWEAVGIISQVASALAIVVTLIYLANQNKQTHVAAATDTTIKGTEIKGTEMASHWRGMLVSDAGLAEALARANAGTSVEAAEKLRLNTFFDDLFILAGAIEASGIQSGALHGDSANVSYTLAVMGENPAMVPRWHQQGTWMNEFSPHFTRAVNEKLAGQIPGRT
jgi:hypothetical protein